jgi:transcriptional regulator with XRE-family HTH domain
MLKPVVTGQQNRPERPRPLLRIMLGDVLRRTRLDQRRTLADVARAAKVSMPYLSEVERGRKEASSEVLAAICDALRIDLADLLAEAGSDLLGERARPARVVRLGLVPGQVAAPRPPGSGSAPQARAAATCLLAA